MERAKNILQASVLFRLLCVVSGWLGAQWTGSVLARGLAGAAGALVRWGMTLWNWLQGSLLYRALMSVYGGF